MNDPEESLSDERLHRLLKAYRDIELPLEAHIANRAAVRQRLATCLGPVWWKRTVSVPVPVAIAASIVVLLATAALVRPVASGLRVEEPSRVAAISSSDLIKSVTTDSNPTRAPSWRIQRSFIRTLTSATATEPIVFHVLENRDDS